jgi:hypothetical protein
MKLEFPRRIFSKNIGISSFMKFRPVGAELFHADGRTDMTKLIVASRNFANAPKNIIHLIMNTANKMQRYRLIYYSKSALHVSGDVFAHHQEHLTVFTASGSIHPSRCRLVSWMS